MSKSQFNKKNQKWSYKIQHLFAYISFHTPGIQFYNKLDKLNDILRSFRFFLSETQTTTNKFENLNASTNNHSQKASEDPKTPSLFCLKIQQQKILTCIDIVLYWHVLILTIESSSHWPPLLQNYQARNKMHANL